MTTRDENDWIAEILKIKNNEIRFDQQDIMASVFHFNYYIQTNELHNKLAKLI
jgi:hypothetical protein